MVTIILGVVLIGGAAACGPTATPVNTATPASPAFDRHGLPSNVPLPDGVAFELMQTVTKQSGETDHEWFWIVNSPNDPATVQAFYKINLPRNGWTGIQSGSPRSGSLVVGGCQSGTILGALSADAILVLDSQGNTTSTITAPTGGSALELTTSTDTAVIAANCH